MCLVTGLPNRRKRPHRISFKRASTVGLCIDMSLCARRVCLRKLMLLEMTTKTVTDFIFKSWNVYINVLLTYLLSSCLQWRFRFSKFFITTDVCTVVMRSVGFVCVSVCVSVCLLYLYVLFVLLFSKSLT